MDKQAFKQILHAKNIDLSDKQLELFDSYYHFLVQENAKYNLTSITEEAEVYEKHFYDSLSLIFDKKFDGSVVDVGSGGGFPSVPLKIVYPELDLTVLDATNKKISFIQQLADHLGLTIKTVCARAEEYEGKFDYVVARSVASLDVLVELCCNLVKTNGCLVAMKGSQYKIEIDKCSNAMELLGYRLDHCQEYHLPEEKSLHCNIFLKKEKSHQLKYPRNYAKIKKNPL